MFRKLEQNGCKVVFYDKGGWYFWEVSKGGVRVVSEPFETLHFCIANGLNAYENLFYDKRVSRLKAKKYPFDNYNESIDCVVNVLKKYANKKHEIAFSIPKKRLVFHVDKMKAASEFFYSEPRAVLKDITNATPCEIETRLQWLNFDSMEVIAIDNETALMQTVLWFCYILAIGTDKEKNNFFNWFNLLRFSGRVQLGFMNRYQDYESFSYYFQTNGLTSFERLAIF